MKNNFWIVCAGACLCLSACGKKSPAPASTTPPPPSTSAESLALSEPPPPPAPEPPVPSAAAAESPGALEGEKIPEPSLAEVRQALELWVFKRNDAPKSLNDLVKEGFLKRLPTPPPGKQFKFDPRTMHVTLGDQ